MLHTTDEKFEQDVLQAEKPVILDFWAEWCAPCKAISPVLDELMNEYQDKITFAKLNIDDNRETPQKYGVRGIPTLIIFKNGDVIAIKSGIASKSQLQAFIDSNI